MIVCGGLKNSWEKRRSERQRRKGKIYSTKCRVPENSKEILESLLKRTMKKKKKRETIEWERREISS